MIKTLKQLLQELHDIEKDYTGDTEVVMISTTGNLNEIKDIYVSYTDDDDTADVVFIRAQKNT